ncbi:MAG: sulfotransferase [Cyanothece sp. SIO1E1]|nr:sulfotransferase [Cyanothece sp. SIO1E1]
MSSNPLNFDLRTQVKPFNFLRLARQTIIADRKQYHSCKRSFSIHRCWRMLVPNLKRPIFIVGAPRSGTTFLGRCLSRLDEVSYHFEPVATKAAARYVYASQWSTFQARWFYRSVYAWLMQQHFDADLRLAEKTPRNCFLIDFLVQAFPQAQFIHIIRDGRDAALSYSKKPWLKAAQISSKQHEPGGYQFGPYARFWVEPDRVHEFETTSDIHRCIWAWRRHTESALKSSANLPDHQYHQLSYEALVTSPTEEAKRLLNFLGISEPRSCRQFHAAVAQAKPDSVGLWQRELSANQLQQIEAEAGPLLHLLGYMPSNQLVL